MNKEQSIEDIVRSAPAPEGVPEHIVNEMREAIIEGAHELSQNQSDIRPSNSIRIESSESREFSSVLEFTGAFNPSNITMQTYKAMRKDPMIGFGLDILKAPVNNIFRLGKWDFHSNDIDIAQFCRDQFNEKWRGLMRHCNNALDFRFQAFEVPWERFSYSGNVRNPGTDKLTKLEIPNAWRPSKFKDFDPDGMKIWQDGKRDIAKIRPQTTATDIPADRAFVFTNQYEFGNVFGVSRLETAYSPWWWNSMTYAAMNRYIKRKADPSIIAYAPADDRKDSAGNKFNTLDQALVALRAIRNGNPVAVPMEFDTSGNKMWDVQYLQDNKRSDMFLYYIQHLEIKKLHGLFIPERVASNEDSTGSFGMIQILSQRLTDSIEDFLQSMLDQINTVIVPRMVKLNFGDGAESCRLVTEQLQRSDKDSLVEIVKSLLDVEKTMEQTANSVSANIDTRGLLDQADIPITQAPVVSNRARNDDISNDMADQARDILTTIALDIDCDLNNIKGISRYKKFIKEITGSVDLANEHADRLKGEFKDKPVLEWVEFAVEDLKKKT